jgi:hypothetical protein
MKGRNIVQLVGYVGQDLKETKNENGHRVAIRVTRRPVIQIKAHHLLNLDC